MKLSPTLSKFWVLPVVFAVVESVVILLLDIPEGFVLAPVIISVIWAMVNYTKYSKNMSVEDYSEPLDAFILKILEEKVTPTMLCQHTVTFNGVELWVANYPYAYGWVRPGSKEEGMPSEKTKEKLRDYILELKLKGVT